MTEFDSKYIDSTSYLERYGGKAALALRQAGSRTLAAGTSSEQDYLRSARNEYPKLIPFLTGKCGLEFRGRVLEIGAGGAWLTAELSKLPKVVEIIAMDFSPVLLKERAPKVFKLLNANTSKITRMPGDFHNLPFPNNHFDFVVCSSVLHYADNIVQVLREAKRVLKPGGQFVALREPVWPLVKLKSHAKIIQKLLATGVNERFYTLSDYKEFYKQAALPLEVYRVNISTGFKYYVNKVVNGFTHARYALVGSKRAAAVPARAASLRHK